MSLREKRRRRKDEKTFNYICEIFCIYHSVHSFTEARSQARRICNRLDAFKEVIPDFSRVEVMGQGFADEIFRVFALEHPQITVRPINMIPEVERMIRHVSRGHIPGNVCIPGDTDIAGNTD